MAPIAITTSLTSPPGLPLGKSSLTKQFQDQGLGMDEDGSSTPYSTTSTAVSENGGDEKFLASPKQAPLTKTIPNPEEEIVKASIPKVRYGEGDYYSQLIASSAPKPSTKAGTTVYGSGIAVLEALAVKHSESVWVYDDASAVGFGSRLTSWKDARIHPVQTRQGAGLELAGYTSRSTGRISVFASTSTLPYLLSSLDRIKGDIVINLATTSTSDSLQLEDSLAGQLKSLVNLPEEWKVVFSSRHAVDNAATIYASGGKVIHVVESTYAAREVTSYVFPSPVSEEIQDFEIVNGDAQEITVVPALHLSSIPHTNGVLTLNTLSPDADALLDALSGPTPKTVSVSGPTKADADALRNLILSTLYSASGSSKTAFPTVKSVVLAPQSTSVSAGTKTVSFYTSPTSPLPELVSHLFLSAPTLHTRLAQFGFASARGLKSTLTLTPSICSPQTITLETPSDVTWISDANVFKDADLISRTNENGIIVFELPWTEEEVPLKLSRSEIQLIQKKNIRVFLLDLDPTSPLKPTSEQVVFLLLYTGQQKLPAGIQRVLEAFHGGQLGRDEIEVAQAGLSELDAAAWTVPELEEGKTEKIKAEWQWDALPGSAGIVTLEGEDQPRLGAYDLAARHLLFREAFSVPDAPTTDSVTDGPGINSLRPSTTDQTYLATVSEFRRLTPVKYDRNVFHLELDTAGTGLKYEIGEAIGIHGWNDTAEVLDFCNWYGLEPDSLVSFPNPTRPETTETRTIFQLLQQNIDLFGRPGKAFYAALSKLATSKADSMTLKFISAPEGAELFKKMGEKETVTFADVLYKFRTARPSMEELVGLIPEIKPRHYSIASSQKAVGDKVELLIVTVDWINSKGSPRYGQCTRYLAALKPGDKVTVSVKPSVMKLPPDDRQPVIMAGLGTGAAPFRAFMQHRAWQKSQGIEVGPLLYYFGSRYRSQEYLYGEEIEAYMASGIISHAGLAFSRDTKAKVYIQHKMGEDSKLLSELLTGKGKDAAYFYLCGPTWPVPDVYEALVGGMQKEQGMTREKAEEYLDELKEQERYVLEVY